MKHFFFVIILVIGVSSCATIVNTNLVEIDISSQTDSVQICINNDTSVWHNLPTSLVVKRSKNDLLLAAKKNDSITIIPVRSKLSNSFWLGNFFMGGVVGYLVDFSNERRYTYPSDITINIHSEKLYRPTHLIVTPPKKGVLSLTGGIPEGNHFYINKGNGYGQTFGFLGIVLGLEYYITDKYALSANVGGVADFMLPIPAPVDYYGARDHTSALFSSVQIGSYYKQLYYSCGLQYNKTQYRKWDVVETEIGYSNIATLVVDEIQNNLGIVLSSHYKFTNKFGLGFSYYPSFIAFDNGIADTEFSHFFTFNLVLAEELYRPK